MAIRSNQRSGPYGVIPDPGYVAALAIEGNGLRLSCWQYAEGFCCDE